jgi:hypothetical protein
MANENEVNALVSFFKDCGYAPTHKGLIVKVSGEPTAINHLFDIFIMTALI